jgi:hypothetical protein
MIGGRLERMLGVHRRQLLQRGVQLVGITRAVHQPRGLRRSRREHPFVDELTHALGRNPAPLRDGGDEGAEEVVEHAFHLLALLGRHGFPREGLGGALVGAYAYDVGLDLDPVEKSTREQALETQAREVHGASGRDPQRRRGAAEEDIARVERLGIRLDLLAGVSERDQRAAKRLPATPAAEAAFQLDEHAPHVGIPRRGRQRLEHLEQPELTAGAERAREAEFAERGAEAQAQPETSAPRQPCAEDAAAKGATQIRRSAPRETHEGVPAAQSARAQATQRLRKHLHRLSSGVAAKRSLRREPWLAAGTSCAASRSGGG